MSLLKYSEKLGRKVMAAEDIAEHGKSTFTKLKTLIREGKTDEALELVDYVAHEGKGLHDLYCDWTYADLDYVAKKYGEEEARNLLHHARTVLNKVFYGRIGRMTVRETVEFFAEAMRAHRTGPGELGDFVVREEPDRYVMEFDPCGSGGRMRRTGELDGTAPRTSPPLNLGKTQQAYDWTWGESGVPYYCVHCSLWHEVMAIDAIGYPVKITEYSEDPSVPCVWLFYKDPDLIPDHYFTRVGKKKDPAAFKR